MSSAYACLSDKGKRSSYDTWGTEDQSKMGGFGGMGGGGGDVDAEELFRAFFGANAGGGGGGGGMPVRQFVSFLVKLLLFAGDFPIKYAQNKTRQTNFGDFFQQAGGGGGARGGGAAAGRGGGGFPQAGGIPNQFLGGGGAGGVGANLIRTFATNPWTLLT